VTPWALIRPARLAGSGLLRTQSDARLVDLVRAGNDRAFDAIVLRYNRPLLRHCRRLLPAGRAEDAVQTVFLHALEAMRGDQRELQLSAWLHRIAHNTAIDALRRLDSQWEELGEGINGVEPAHAAAERRARFRSVVADLGSLPERQRRALVLRELEGRSYDEIAATLGVSGSGVRQLLNRARNAMRVGASALVPPALLGRLAGSQAGVRITELSDSPGLSALLAKTTAGVAAGTVALLAVNAPGDRVRVPHPEAKPRPPALESRADAWRSADRTKAPRAGAGSRRAVLPERTRPHAGGRGGGPAGEQPTAGLSVVAEGDGDGVARFGTDEVEGSEQTSRSRPVGTGRRQRDRDDVRARADEIGDTTGPLEVDDHARPVVDGSLDDDVVADAADAPDDDPSIADADVPEGEEFEDGDDDVSTSAEPVPESPDDDDELE